MCRLCANNECRNADCSRDTFRVGSIHLAWLFAEPLYEFFSDGLGDGSRNSARPHADQLVLAGKSHCAPGDASPEKLALARYSLHRHVYDARVFWSSGRDCDTVSWLDESNRRFCAARHGQHKRDRPWGGSIHSVGAVGIGRKSWLYPCSDTLEHHIATELPAFNTSMDELVRATYALHSDGLYFQRQRVCCQRTGCNGSVGRTAGISLSVLSVPSLSVLRVHLSNRASDKETGEKICCIKKISMHPLWFL